MAGNSTNIVLRMALAGRDAVRRGLRDTSGDLGKIGSAGLGAARGIASIGDRAVLGAVKGVGVGIAGIGIAAVGAAAGVTALVKTSLTSLARIERINTQTETVITSMGGAAGVTATHVENLAGELENLTAQEAETTQEGANLLLTFGNIRNGLGEGNDIFDRTVRTMVDMGVAMGQDASASAIQLGKALNDPIKGITALSKVGVSFSNEQKDLITSMTEAGDVMGAQKIILAALEQQFGGSGAAFAKTSEGQIALAEHAWGTFGEAVSTALLPAVGGIAGQVAFLFNDLAENQAPKLEGVFTKVGDAAWDMAERVIGGVSYIANNAGEIGDAIAGAATGQINSGFLAGQIAQIFDLDGATSQKLVLPLDLMFEKGRQIATVLATAFDALRSIPLAPLNLLNDALGWASEHTEAFKRILIGAAIAYGTARVVLLGYAVAQGVAAARTAVATVATTANSIATRISTSTIGTWIGVKALEAAAWVRSTAATIASTAAMAVHRVAYGVSYLATWIGVKGLELAAWVRSTAATVASTAVMVGHRVAYGVGYLTTFIGVKALELGAWVRATAATVASTVAQGAARGAIIAATAAQWLMNAAMSANPIGLVIAAVAALAAGLVWFFTKTEIGRKAWDGITNAFRVGWDWVKKVGGAIFDLYMKFSPLGIAITTVKNNWSSITTVVGSFISKIKDAVTWVGKLADKLTGGLVGKALDAVGVDIDGARALGGPVRAGGSYLVGERGAEIFRPASDGVIIPAQRTAELMATSTRTPTAPLPTQEEMYDDLPQVEFGDAVLVVDSREIGRASLRGLRKDANRR